MGKNQFGKNKVLLITQTIEGMHELIKAGVKVDKLNVGGKSQKPDTVSIINEVSITQEEFDRLKDLHDHHSVEIYVQALPNMKRVDYKNVVDKFN